jgi:hypothetical protein
MRPSRPTTTPESQLQMRQDLACAPRAGAVNRALTGPLREAMRNCKTGVIGCRRTFRTAAALAALSLSASAPLCAAPAPDAPPPPDYAQPDAWVAWPGRASDADVVPPGVAEASLPAAGRADVFFIHPTTYLFGSAPNARYDEPGITSTQIRRGVLRFQASAFNGCCRIYAPLYRQASIQAFMQAGDAQAQTAFDLAYSDVLRAFDYYLQHENHGRPFIIASHSQGSLHAMRLLQERVAGTTLQQRLVVAYVIGYDLPREIERRGIPVCRTARQTGCLVDWNSVKAGASDEERQNRRLIWLDGRYQHLPSHDLVCVNPLNWQLGGDAPASLNLGALPGTAAAELLAPVAGLTGARCEAGLLRVDIPVSKRGGFANVLTLFGSYHVYDYNLFYLNIRRNARERVQAFEATDKSWGHCVVQAAVTCRPAA